MEASVAPLARSGQIQLEPCKILPLPAFSVKYPAMLNREILGAHAKSAMEPAWNAGTFGERRLEIFRLSNAFLIDEGLIFDSDLNYIGNCLDYGIPDAEIARARSDIEREMAKTTMMRSPGLSVVVKKRNPHNYGHFLIEMLPLAVIGRMFFGDLDPAFILHRVSAAMEDVVLRALRLMSVRLDRVSFTDYRVPTYCEDLIFMRGLTHHGQYMSPLAVQIVEAMSFPFPEAAVSKIFIKRKPGWQTGRILFNEDEVFERLKPVGYIAFDPGSLALEEQIALFHGADRVVGALGAGMANIVFCKPGTKVALLVPSDFPDTFFWFIANHKGLDYTEIRGAQIQNSGADSWKGGFTIRDSDISYLERL